MWRIQSVIFACQDTSYKKRKRLGDTGDLDSDDYDDDNLDYHNQFEEDLRGEEKAEGGGLLLDLDSFQIGVPKTPEDVSAQWFSQDVFKDANLTDDLFKNAQATKVPAAEEQDDCESLESLEDSDDAKDVVQRLVNKSTDFTKPKKTAEKVTSEIIHVRKFVPEFYSGIVAVALAIA